MSDKQKVRSAMRAALINGGVPADAVDEVVDLSLHASDQAMEAMNAVILRASDPRISVCCIGVATSQLLANLQGIQQGLPDLAEKLGMKPPVVVQCEVSA